MTNDIPNFKYKESFQSAEGRTRYEYICTRCNSWSDDVPFSMNEADRNKIFNKNHTKEACDLIIIKSIQNS